jgi:hypothetical protein
MARRTLLVLLGVFVTAACTELPAITEAPTDGGAPTDAQARDAEVPDAQTADGGPKADAGPPEVFKTVSAVCGESIVGSRDVDGFSVACDRGWARVLNATARGTAFAHESPCWDPTKSGNDCRFDAAGGRTDIADARFPAYSRLAGTRVRIQFLIGGALKGSIEFEYAEKAAPLGSLMGGAGTVGTGTPSPPTGFTVYPPTTAGINLGDAGFGQVRLGIVGSPMPNAAPTSWLGVGGRFAATCGSANDTANDNVTAGNGFTPACNSGKTAPTFIGTDVQVSVQ